MLCLCKLSEAHGRLPVPFCVAACGYDYHVWHELFMNRLPPLGAPRRNPMRNRRPSRSVRRLRNKLKSKAKDQTLVWPFLVL